MKEKRTVYIVEDADHYTFKVFDTLAEAKMYILHEYLDWLEATSFNPEEDNYSWVLEDLKSIDKHAYVEDVYYTHQAEYCGE